MLRAALDATYKRQSPKPKIYQDIDWLMQQLNALAGKRNDAIHAPLIFVNDADTRTIEIMPNYFFGNPRATQLANKHLVEEFWWYKDHLGRLAEFAERLHYAFTFSEFPWPDRPQLPSRGHYKISAKTSKSRSK